MLPNQSLGNKKTSYALALVKFDSLKTLQYVYNILSKEEFLNEDKVQIQIGMAYDTRCLGERKWVGVVLRNLPAESSVAGILKNFKSPLLKE